MRADAGDGRRPRHRGCDRSDLFESDVVEAGDQLIGNDLEAVEDLLFGDVPGGDCGVLEGERPAAGGGRAGPLELLGADAAVAKLGDDLADALECLSPYWWSRGPR